MKTLTFGKILIEMKLNPPIEETNFLKEDFDSQSKPSYATSGITELLHTDNQTVASLIVGKVFQELQQTAKNQDLDYLQVINLNGEDTWIIDDGSTICWMRKDEY